MSANRDIPLAERLESESLTKTWLDSCGIADTDRGRGNLLSIASQRITLDLLDEMHQQLSEVLPSVSDPDMALNNLERFFDSVSSPLSWSAMFSRDRAILPALLQMFSASQHIADAIIRQPSVFDTMWQSQGAPTARKWLIDEVVNRIATASDDQQAAILLNSFKQHHVARIAYGDIIRGQRVEVVTRQISHLADAICEAAVRRIHEQLTEAFGTPQYRDNRCRSVVLALGKLGGRELNYSSDIDLVFVYDGDGETNGPKRINNAEYFDHFVRRFVKLLTMNTLRGTAYRVDLRLRPDGAMAASAVTRSAALSYYDRKGRVWERQAMVKAHPIAGDIALGREFLKELEPWIYKHHLSRSEISGIQALKRQIEVRSRRAGTEHLDVKVGQGGIRDIEFVIQFLQLLLGADHPQIRTGNTLEAIGHLERAGGLSMQERTILERNYVFLRKIEHRLQIMFDTQTHRMPSDERELQKLARRMSFDDVDAATALTRFQQRYDQVTSLNRRILDHILHDAIEDPSNGAATSAPISDLILARQPTDDEISEVLKPFRFKRVNLAYKNLESLAQESLPFLTNGRSRHFLATIAPELLAKIAATPDPDQTLSTLSVVSDSLGGKSALWELFHANPPSLELYVRLCAACPYLVEILTSHPGMLDELLDSLSLHHLAPLKSLANEISDLCTGAVDLGPILISFKNTHHLRVGARDILGKENIRSTTAKLADVAEVIFGQIVRQSFERLVSKMGPPTASESGEVCEPIVVAVGKFGGQEPNYHSDLDVLFLFEGDGMTRPTSADVEPTSNHHFFSELGQLIIRSTKAGPHGQLYPVDARLRPDGKSSPLATSLSEFEKYFDGGHGRIWERMALCKSRVILGNDAARSRTADIIRKIITGVDWLPSHGEDIFQMRLQMQQGANARNLKRGPGGTVDVEFVIQSLQLRHGKAYPQILIPGVWPALEALRSCGLLSAAEADQLTEGYTFLRGIEARLRLMNTAARHDFPTADTDQYKLAYLLQWDGHEALWEQAENHMQILRRILQDVLRRP